MSESELSPGYVVQEADEADTEEVVIETIVWSTAEAAAYHSGFEAGYKAAQKAILAQLEAIL